MDNQQQSDRLQIGVETMMHLTCTNMPEEKLSDALSKVQHSLGRPYSPSPRQPSLIVMFRIPEVVAGSF